MSDLSEAEENAIAFLKHKGGSCLVTDVSEKNSRGLFGEAVPGMTIFKKLEKKGLVNITEEEPILDVPEDDPLYGFTFTPMIELVTT